MSKFYKRNFLYPIGLALALGVMLMELFIYLSVPAYSMELDDKEFTAEVYTRGYCLEAKFIMVSHIIARTGYYTLLRTLDVIQMRRGECFVRDEPVKFRFLRQAIRINEDPHINGGYVVAGEVKHEGKPTVVYRFFSDKALKKILGPKI